MAINYTKGAAAPPAVSLSKVTLDRHTPTVSLRKQSGQLKVNLNWQARPAQAKPAGFLKRLTGDRGIDLDLGCLYELIDGRKGVVQSLGNSFGQLDRAPYIMLDGDDRTGTKAGGEDLFVNLGHVADIRRVLVFACIYEGVPSFDQADAVVTLTPATGPPIEMRLDEAAGKARICAVALLENTGGELIVRREVQYIDGGQSALDRAYGWGMRWAAGRK